MNSNRKVLGIIGGMGPLAAAVFYQKIALMTKAECDQDHIRTLMISDPSIPKRVEYILGENDESPEPALRDIACKLQEMDADIIVMPCVTAHFFYNGIADALKVPMINMLSETAGYLKEKSIKSAGILATRATLKSGILQEALRAEGINSILPDEVEMGKISAIIFDEIKKGRKPDISGLISVIRSMCARGAEKCLIACTDLSVCMHDKEMSSEKDRYIDLMDILAAAAVKACGYEVNKNGQI